MKVLLFGGTGMVGQGVLRECLLAPQVQRVVAVGRRPTGSSSDKLQEFVHADLMHLQPVEQALVGFDACFFCLGVSSVGMGEAEYTRLTYDLTMAIATTLVRTSPNMTFIYVSGRGTDSTEHGRSMWARVKGRTENALLQSRFRAVYMFRPGVIMPLHGIRSKSWYNAFYVVAKPLLPILRKVFPTMITTTEQVGRAMISVARNGYPRRILEVEDLIRF